MSPKSRLKAIGASPMLLLGRGGGKVIARRRIFQDSENDPPHVMTSPSKFAVVRQLSKSRLPLEDHDANSQDSGISEDSKSEFRFVEPCGAAPRRMSNMDCSPLRSAISPVRGLASPVSPQHFAMECSPRTLYDSPRTTRRPLSFSYDSGASSIDTLEDGFMDFIFPSDKLMDEDAQMGGNQLGNLLSAEIVHSTSPKFSPSTPESKNATKTNMLFRKAMSENITPTNLDMDSPSIGKRPIMCTDESSPTPKRHKPLSSRMEPNLPADVAIDTTPVTAKGHRMATLFHYGFKVIPSPPSANTQLSPCSETNIKLALNRAAVEELIGDFSRPFALPLITGKHQDLKTISPETLALLIRGGFSSQINSFRIIDCRYPYEYEGGHIQGALNLYTREQINDLLSHIIPSNNLKRNILVFHCEFSSERGPCLFRWLRKTDRASHKYPQLTYPEMYLVDGGYRSFFSIFPELCQPRSYKPMLHPSHSSDLKYFKAKSKTWAAAGASTHKTTRCLSRLNL